MSASESRHRNGARAKVGHPNRRGNNGKVAAVDERLSKFHGGRPATWHSRRCGPNAVNQLAATIIREWRATGDVEAVAAWTLPIEAALGAIARPAAGSTRLRAALADTAEDDAEARYFETPCEQTARDLIRRRAADRAASLEHDREIAARFGIVL
ncbi:MAG TPA: hypothetical protein VFS33_10815 [Gemmatimonadales bacterium]|nr:hypothetical protein [Gemmatimonadales bacterium]